MSGEQKVLVQKVTALVISKFGGEWQQAFRHYAKGGVNRDLIDSDELTELLEDAGIGNAFTRGAWVRGIIEKLDTDRDRKIGWQEFEAVINA